MERTRPVLDGLRPEFMTARSLEFKKTRARGSRWRLSVINRVPTPERACFSHTTPGNMLDLRFACVCVEFARKSTIGESAQHTTMQSFFCLFVYIMPTSTQIRFLDNKRATFNRQRLSLMLLAMCCCCCY